MLLEDFLGAITLGGFQRGIFLGGFLGDISLGGFLGAIIIGGFLSLGAFSLWLYFMLYDCRPDLRFEVICRLSVY